MREATLPLLAVTALLCAGCGGATARQVARLELANLVEYEAQLDRKIRAENRFAAETAGNIQKSFAMIEQPVLDLVVLRSSYQAADEMVSQPPTHVTDWDVSHFVRSALASYVAEEEAWQKLGTRIRAELAAGTTKLKRSKSELKKVRQLLEKLQSEPTAKSRIEELKVFVEAAGDRYEELGEGDGGS